MRCGGSRDYAAGVGGDSMAIENQIIAPRADGEGSLGTATLRWGDVRAEKINGENVLTEDKVRNMIIVWS